MAQKYVLEPEAFILKRKMYVAKPHAESLNDGSNLNKKFWSAITTRTQEHITAVLSKEMHGYKHSSQYGRNFIHSFYPYNHALDMKWHAYRKTKWLSAASRFLFNKKCKGPSFLSIHGMFDGILFIERTSYSGKYLVQTIIYPRQNIVGFMQTRNNI